MTIEEIEKIVQALKRVEPNSKTLEYYDVLLSRIHELEEGIRKHYRENKISSLESDGTYSTSKCRGLEELIKLLKK